MHDTCEIILNFSTEICILLIFFSFYFFGVQRLKAPSLLPAFDMAALQKNMFFIQ